MTLYRRRCPSSMELAHYQLDMLDTPEARARIEAHLRTCVRCRSDLQELQNDMAGENDMMWSAAHRNNVIGMPLQKTNRKILQPEFMPESKSGVRGDARIKRVIASAESTVIWLSFEPLPGDRLKLTVQLSAQGDKVVEWRGGIVTVQQENQTVSSCKINDYQTATCELPRIAPISLRMVAADETLIEFNNVSP